MKLLTVPALLCLALPAPALAANQVLLRNAEIGAGSTAQSIAADRSGNLFVAANGTDSYGVAQIRVTKTDPNGAVLATYIVPGSASAAATDAQGDLVLVGNASAPFPLVKPLFPSAPSSPTVGFVMKLDPQLDNILFSTFVGSAWGQANAVTVDPAGDIYLTGTTVGGIPVTPGALQIDSPAGAVSGYLMEISSNGDRLLYATYFGVTVPVPCEVNCGPHYHTPGAVAPLALAIGPSGQVAMAGTTDSQDLPVTPGVIGPACNCPGPSSQQGLPGVLCGDAGYAGFLAVFAPGSPFKLSWATYIPASGITAVAFDPAGDPIIGGYAWDTRAPMYGDEHWRFFGAYGVTGKVNSTGTALVWLTSFGAWPSQSAGNASFGVMALDTDSQGGIVIGGNSQPDQLPQIAGAAALGPAYVARLSSDGAKVQALYTGPAAFAGSGLAMNPAGNFVSLGNSGALWMETGASGPSFQAIGNAAGGPASFGIANCEIVSMYGNGIGPQTALQGQVVNGAFTTSLGGYQVLFDGRAAPLLYAGPTLTTQAAASSIFPGSVAGTWAALNQDGSVNSAQNPAKAGSVVSIFVSGGAVPCVNGGVVAGTNFLTASYLPVSVLVSAQGSSVGMSAEVLYAGQAPELIAGLMQVNFRLPETLPSKTYVTVAVQVGSAMSGSGWISVTP